MFYHLCYRLVFLLCSRRTGFRCNQTAIWGNDNFKGIDFKLMLRTKVVD
jgi:hypothetical protein